MEFNNIRRYASPKECKESMLHDVSHIISYKNANVSASQNAQTLAHCYPLKGVNERAIEVGKVLGFFSSYFHFVRSVTDLIIIQRTNLTFQ